MKTYQFTMLLGRSPRIDEAIAGKLFEAGCDDALSGVRYGVSFLDFDREATSFREAVLSAKDDIERADDRLRVCRIEPDDLVSMAEIARRSERTRENIRQLVTGCRGTKDFPPPVRGLSTKSPLWSWEQVTKWMVEYDPKILDEDMVEQAREIVRLNSELEQSPPERGAQVVLTVIVPQVNERPLQWPNPRIRSHGWMDRIRRS